MENKGLLAGLVAIALVALSALAFISLKSPSVIVTGGGVQQASEEARYGGTTGLDSLSLTGDLSVSGALTVATTTIGGGTLYVDPLNDNVAVNTTTGILADLYVYSGSTSVSSTVAIGDSLNTTKSGTLCFWNGTNYTRMWFAAGSVTPLYVAATGCTN